VLGDNNRWNTYIGHTFRIKSRSGRLLREHVVATKNDTVLIDSFDSFYFRKRHKRRTGIDWINYAPKDPSSYFIWPANYVGEETPLLLSPPHYIEGQEDSHEPIPSKIRVQGVFPRIFTVDNFLSPDECDILIAEARKDGVDMRRSTVGGNAEISPERNSTNTWLRYDASPVISRIAERAFGILKIPFNLANWTSIGENIQVLHYDRTEWYREHYDYFPVLKRGQGNRMATFFLYLTDVEEGGETYFPWYGNQYVDLACVHPDGFRITPKRGRAVLFYSMLPDGNLDTRSLHGGCQVRRGEKWSANFWIWEPRIDK